MKITKKTSVGGQYVKKGEDIKDGDIVKVLNPGDVVIGEYGEQHVFKIMTKNGERNCRFNQTTLNNLHDAFGEESEGWAGQEVKTFMVKALVSGKFQNVLYFAPKDWIMDEEGRFCNPNNQANDAVLEPPF